MCIVEGHREGTIERHVTATRMIEEIDKHLSEVTSLSCAQVKVHRNLASKPIPSQIIVICRAGHRLAELQDDIKRSGANLNAAGVHVPTDVEGAIRHIPHGDVHMTTQTAATPHQKCQVATHRLRRGVAADHRSVDIDVLAYHQHGAV